MPTSRHERRDPAAELDRLRIALGLIDRPDTTPDRRDIRMDAEAILRRQGYRYRLLSRPQELGLAQRARSGDELAKARLVFHNVGLVWKQVDIYWPVVRALEPDAPETLRNDFIQEGMRALLRAVDEFDPLRGARFSTYATTAIKHALHAFARKRGMNAAKRNTRRAFGDARLFESGLAQSPHREQGGGGSYVADVGDDGRRIEWRFVDEGDSVDLTFPVINFTKVGLGGLDRNHVLVDSLDDVRARWCEAELRGVQQPVFVCRLCGSKHRSRSIESVLGWWEHHPRPEGGICGEDESMDEHERARRERLRRQGREEELRRWRSSPDRLARVREEDRLLKLLRQGDETADREWRRKFRNRHDKWLTLR